MTTAGWPARPERVSPRATGPSVSVCARSPVSVPPDRCGTRVCGCRPSPRGATAPTAVDTQTVGAGPRVGAATAARAHRDRVGPHSNNCYEVVASARTPVADSPRGALARRQSLGVWRRASVLSRVHLLEDLNVQGLVGHQPFQSPILVLQLLQTLGVAEFHPAELALPAVVGLLADGVLADQLGHRQTGLGLLQDRDDLLFTESLPFHLGSFLAPARLPAKTHSGNGPVSGEQVSDALMIN